MEQSLFIFRALIHLIDERNELEIRLQNVGRNSSERDELHKEWMDVDCVLGEIEHLLQRYYKKHQPSDHQP